MNIKIPRLNRRRERGAALVEAAVVIPVMLVFIGLIMFTHKSYATKMDKQLGTRADTLYYASHACKGAAPASVSTSTSSDDGTIPGSKADQGASRVGGSNSPGASAAVNRNGNLAKSQPADTTVSGTAVQDRQTVNLTRQISAASEVACNEEVFASKWTAVFQEIGSLYSSHLGF